MARGKPLFAVRISLYTCSGTLFRFGTTLEERIRSHPSPYPAKHLFSAGYREFHANF